MRRGLLLALAVALAWCALIFAIHQASPRTRLSAHGLLHVAIAESCARSPAGTLLSPQPPDNPLFAGEPLPYYYFFHRAARALAQLLTIDVVHAFEALLLLSAAAAVVVGWLVGRRLFGSDAAGLTTSFLLFAGAHPQGPLVLLVRRFEGGPRIFADDGSYLWGLVHPLNGALRIGDYYGTLGPLVSSFLNLTARPLALASLLVVVLLLDVAARRPSPLRLAGLALAMMVVALWNPIVAFAVAGAVAAALLGVAVTQRRIADGGDDLSPGRAAALAVALVAGVALAWPWFHHLVRWLAPSDRFTRDDAHVRIAFNLHRAVAMATGAWLVALFAWFGRRRLSGTRRALALVLIVAAAVLALATALLTLPVGNEDSLFHGALVLLAVPAAGIVVPMRRDGAKRDEVARATRRRTLLVHAAFAPMVACVLAAYVGRPALPIAITSHGLERLPEGGDEARLDTWIVMSTPGDAIFVQDPGSDGRTCAGNSSELPALTGRSLFTDYARHYLVAPYRDAPRRAAITAKLVSGTPLDADEAALLLALDREIFVVTYDERDERSAATARRDAALGAPLFEAGPIRVRRCGAR